MQLYVYNSIRAYISHDMQWAVVFTPFGKYFQLRVSQEHCIYNLIRELYNINTGPKVYSLTAKRLEARREYETAA